MASTFASERRGYGLVAPTLAAMAVLTIVPIVVVVTRAAGAEGRAVAATLLGSSEFHLILGRTGIWTVVSVAGALVIGFGAALLLQSRWVRWPGLWRGIFMVPWIIPGVVGATIWKWNYSSNYGLLNHTLQTVGVINEPVQWLSDPSIVLYALAAVQVWSTAPFVMLLLGAALTAVPGERYEAARLDGAGLPGLFRYITLPAVRPTTAIASLMLVTFALNAFTIIWVSTAGGPVGSSTILPVELYRAFQNGDDATVAVIACVQLVISAALALVYVRSMKAGDE
ncbi:carbohydrate ABC transporter permease [Occultella gossypii]|uniref:Sugar ABC transporter permease n=1 Tax=Occultella gossypii TaxID=2800820 RepID=A0ABS7S5Q3_9MICO|nr:sugar ABC transporter permease [Occultella gossypii]MBZ2194964.1 sugar ABC transporter permease [Occultella gossypii]